MHAIEFDPDKNEFLALFCHGTSSASLNSILRNGIRGPDLNAVLITVLSASPTLIPHHDAIAGRISDGPFGVNARRFEGCEFTAWFANLLGIRMLVAEIPRVVSHGGEVYSVTFARVARAALELGLDSLSPRFPDATACVVLFQIPFRLGEWIEESPRTEHSFVRDLARDVGDGNAEFHNILRAVRFVESLPPQQIVWHGTLAQAEQHISHELMSSAARQAIERR